MLLLQQIKMSRKLKKVVREKPAFDALEKTLCLTLFKCLSSVLFLKKYMCHFISTKEILWEIFVKKSS